MSIFITGSNAKLLSGELATLLTGRYVSFYVMPFSFRECCEIRNVAQPTDEDLVEYMNWGACPSGFPWRGGADPYVSAGSVQFRSAERYCAENRSEGRGFA